MSLSSSINIFIIITIVVTAVVNKLAFGQVPMLTVPQPWGGNGIIADPNAQMAAENEEEMAEEGQPVDMAGGQVPQDDMDLSGDPTQQLPPEILQALGGS